MRLGNYRNRLEKLERREATEIPFRFVLGGQLQARGDEPKAGAFTFELEFCEPAADSARVRP